MAKSKSALVSQRKSVKQPNSQTIKQKMQRLSVSQGQMVIAPAAKSFLYKNSGPKVNSARNDRELRVTHTEYIADLPKSSTANWSLNYNLRIQPGNPLMFPWLSTIASAYEMYRINSMRFYVRPVNSTATAGGIYMAIAYDANDAAPSSKMQMLAEESSSAGNYWCETSVKYISNSRQPYKMWYTAPSTPAGSPPQLYAAGALFIASDGNSTNILGDLFCEYDITFVSPSITGFVYGILSQQANPINTATQLTSGANFASSNGYSLISQVDGAAANQGRIQFNVPGNYLLDWQVTGTGTIPATPTWSVFSGSGSVLGGSYAPLLEPSDTDAFDGIYQAIVTILQPNTVINLLLAGVVALTGTNVHKLRVAPYNAGA